MTGAIHPTGGSHQAAGGLTGRFRWGRLVDVMHTGIMEHMKERRMRRSTALAKAVEKALVGLPEGDKVRKALDKALTAYKTRPAKAEKETTEA